MKYIWYLLEKRELSNNRILAKAYSFAAKMLLNQQGSFIGRGAVFHNRPMLPHGFYGIFISSGAIIGQGSTIFHHVTIGSNTLRNSNKQGSPNIGENCYIGAGAKIIGNITIGNNVRIGANCVVVKDVPNNSVVVNQPSRVIVKEENLDNKFLEIKKLQNSSM